MEAIKLVQSVKDTLRNTNLKLALAGAAAAAVLAFNVVGGGGGVAQAHVDGGECVGSITSFIEDTGKDIKVQYQARATFTETHPNSPGYHWGQFDHYDQANEWLANSYGCGVGISSDQDAAAAAADEPEAEPAGTEYLCRNYNDRTYVIGTAGADGELNPIDGVNGNFDPEVDEMQIERDAAGAFTADRELVFPVHVNGKEHGSLYITHLGPEIAEGEETTVCQVSDTHPDR